MKKKILAFVLLFVTLTGYGYEKKAYELILNLKDGSTITYQLDKKVVMTLDQEKLVLTAEDVVAEYLLENIADMNQKEVEVNPEALEHVTATGTLGLVTIYDISGRKVRSIQANEQQQASYNLGDLQQGTYVITDGVTTYKLMKK